MPETWLHQRFAEGPESTIGELLDELEHRLSYLLEDQRQPPGVKIPGETRIPPGLYEVTIRTDSPKFAHYFERWPEWYRGVPWLIDVPGDGVGFEQLGFQYVYWHPGEDDDDSAGCGITGHDYVQDGDDFRIKPGTSRAAFEDVCRAVYQVVLERGDRLFVRVTDELLEPSRSRVGTPELLA